MFTFSCRSTFLFSLVKQTFYNIPKKYQTQMSAHQDVFAHLIGNIFDLYEKIFTIHLLFNMQNVVVHT